VDLYPRSNPHRLSRMRRPTRRAPSRFTAWMKALEKLSPTHGS